MWLRQWYGWRARAIAQNTEWQKCRSKSSLGEPPQVYTTRTTEGKEMASTTKKLKVRRQINLARAGKKRKNHLRLHGSTAVDLPLTMPNANEMKQKQG
jgi:hypothetical protein